jgi:transposase-like protein
MPPLKSNEGIVSEINRLSTYLSLTKEQHFCNNPDCANHTVPVGTKKAYRSFGATASGAKRFQCSLCKKTLTISKPTKGQHDTHQNIDIFKQLVNKVPLSRIVSMLDISWEVLYHRINFIHQQCLKFVANRERKLSTLAIDRLYLSVDRQNYEVNWSQRKDKRNVMLMALATADNTTGYVFGMHVNFDPSLNKEVIEADATAINDSALADPFKKYAHLWLDTDYQKSLETTIKKGFPSTLTDEIEEQYNQSVQRVDIEAFDNKNIYQKLPDYGIQIRAEYTLIAHFYFLRNLLGKVNKFRFFLDQESGIRSACLTAFQSEISKRTCEAFYVKIEKVLTVDEKRRFKREADKRLQSLRNIHSDLSDYEIKLLVLKESIANVKELGGFKDKWISHPFPSMSEANKAMCWLTEHKNFDENHVANLYNKASLHGVDNFFMKVRRRIVMLERPIHSAGSAGRTWNGYGAYNPAMVAKLLDIFRVVHNYIDVKEIIDDNGTKIKTTPAKELGLAKAILDYKDILYFTD